MFEIISNKEKTVVYFSNLKKIFKLDEPTIETFDKFSRGIDIQNEHNGEMILDYIHQDQSAIVRKLDISKNFFNKKQIEKLVIHVSNDCNLRCSYCYADGGNYNSTRKNIDQETCDKIIDKIFNNYTVHQIQFFGGEPMLNIEMIDYICKRIKVLYKEGKIDVLPNFGTISNGTLCNQKIIEVFKEHEISLTISIDGSKKIHDKNRVNVMGKGSYDLIKCNIAKFQEADLKMSGVEVTYTEEHLNQSEDIITLCNDLKENLHVVEPHIAVVSSDDETSHRAISSYILEHVDGLIDSKNSFSILQRLYKGIKSQENDFIPYICSAGVGTFSVSVTGDIYPCFMLNENQEFLMGNIDDQIDEVLNHDIVKACQTPVKDTEDTCKKCFLKNICFGCIGDNYIRTGDILNTPESTCDYFKDLAKKLILKMK